MAKVLLDTDILSEYLKGHDKIVAGHAADYARRYRIFTFTSVTVHELVYGLEFKGASAQLKKGPGVAEPERTDHADCRRLL